MYTEIFYPSAVSGIKCKFTSEPDRTVTETADFNDCDMLYKSHYLMQCR